MAGEDEALLSCIRQNPHQSVTFYEGALKLSRPAWIRTIKRLIEAGLVERTGEKRLARFSAVAGKSN